MQPAGMAYSRRVSKESVTVTSSNGGGGGGGGGGGSGTVRCGASWGAANGKCGTKCANDGGCPSGEKCFNKLDESVCKSSSGGGSSSSGGGSCTVRCGKDWSAANSNCGTACTSNAQCSNGETCFNKLKACSSCKGGGSSSGGGGGSGGSSSSSGGGSSGGGSSGGGSSSSSSGGTKSTVRCGKDWSAANSNCGASCTEDAHCKSGETCYKDLKACKTCSPPPAPSKKSSSGGGGSGGKSSSSSSSSSTNRCGTDYPAANKKCGTKCTGNEDCPSGEKCYNNLDEKVCKTGGPKRCGTSYTAANAKCGTRCASNTDCTSGEKCYNNLDEKVCKSVSINGELILGENTLILSAACCKNPSIIAGIAFAIMMQCIWDHI